MRYEKLTAWIIEPKGPSTRLLRRSNFGYEVRALRTRIGESDSVYNFSSPFSPLCCELNDLNITLATTSS